MSTTENNKRFVTEFIDGLFTRGDLGAVDQYLSDDYVDHDPPFGSDGTAEGMWWATPCTSVGTVLSTATGSSRARSATR